MNQDVLNKIIEWGKKENDIRVLLLTGSLAGKKPKDELSDYDIAVFTNDIQKYTRHDTWMKEIAHVLVYEPCELIKNGKVYPTRLVIYEDGLQIDFAFFDMEYFKTLTEKETLPVEYNMGYKVLLDKDNITSKLQKPNYKYPYAEKPTKKEFDLLVHTFFFEAFKEAKALARNDLWHAKIRDWSIKKRLLRMIEWHEKTVHGWNYDTNVDAKRMQSWVSSDIWQALHGVFSSFYAESSWNALFATLKLFNKLAVAVAEGLSCEYPVNIDQDITQEIRKLKSKVASNEPK